MALLPDSPELSVVIPAHNEAENIVPLIDEVRAALAGVARYEIVVIDDGSSDGTDRILREAAATRPELRPLRHRRQSGQSAALTTGIRLAQAPLVATLDGDGQNDPADIPALLARLRADNLDMVAGWRAQRKDTRVKRLSSRLANRIRGGLLNDRTPDTGCGLKVFRRQLFLEFPHFDHMHRFMPALAIRAGGQVASVPVNHRPRLRGASHYGFFDRLWVGIVDILGMIWLNRRIRLPGGADDLRTPT